MLNEETVELINKIDRSLIRHSQIDKAIKSIERSIMLSKSAKEPTNILLTGIAGTGKTTACEYIVKKFKSYIEAEEGREITIIPAFYTSIPENATPTRVAKRMLNAMSVVEPKSIEAETVTEQLRRNLSVCRTNVILLDELQHLLKDKSRRKDVKDWLKTLINDTKIPLIIVGTPDCQTIINENDDDNQIARRFRTQIKLSNLLYGTSNKKGEFKLFLESLIKAFKDVTKFNFELDFRTSTHSLSVYAATGGNPADTVNLFKEACFTSLENNRKIITKDDLVETYDRLTFPNAIQINGNPFEMDARQINAGIRNILGSKK